MSTFFPLYEKSKKFLAEQTGYSDINPAIIFASVIPTWSVSILFISPIVRKCCELTNCAQSLLKVRLQTGRSTLGAYQTLRNVVREEGFLGLYAGYRTGMFFSILFSLFFSIYEPVKRYIIQNGYNTSIYLPIASAASMMTAWYGTWCLFYICSVATYPNDVINARLQYQGTQKVYNGIMDAARKIWQAEGIAGMYSGIRMYLIRLVFGNLVTVSTYEFMVRNLGNAMEEGKL